MNIESWCTVERNSNAEWTRVERKHHNNAFNSTVFDSSEAERYAMGRVEWSMAEKPDNTKLRKKRHFQQKCKNGSTISVITDKHIL